MLADGSHDELRSLDDGRSIAIGVDGAGGDHISLLEFALSVTGGAIVIAAVDHVQELAGGAYVDLEVPVVVAFAEVEAVTVDFAAPLFWCPAAMTLDDDTWVLGQPVLKFSLSCLVGGADPLTVR